jgi:lipopolysaccharide transport system permease protein/teichoic acid transport system permease protein
MIRKAFEVLDFLKDVYSKRSLIIVLAKKDFMTQYIDSVLGLFWAFVHPLVMVLILWFIFSFGFKVMPVKNVPFVVWLTAGMAPWFFFLNSLVGNTGVIVQNSFLVKKVVFRVSILPIAKTLSSCIIHFIFIGLLIILMLFNGLHFSIWWFQVCYYTFALIVLIMGLTWATSSLNVFLKDVSQLVAIVIQFGFWGTPIFWNIKMIPEKYHILIKLNPMYYIVEGYRDSFIYHTPFWIHWELSLYFWSVTIFTLLLGIITFKKLRPHFSDVL